MKLKNIRADFVVYARNFLRTRSSIFFALLFPVIFLLVFGAIFSGNQSKIPVYVQNLDNGSPLASSFMTAVNSSGVLSVVNVPQNVNIKDYISQNSISTALVIPQAFSEDIASHQKVNISFYYNPAQSTSQEAEQAIAFVVQDFNFRLDNATPLVLTSTNTISSSGTQYIDYLVPGLIGLSILTSGVFSLTYLVNNYRKEKIFRQLSLTPLTRGEWLVSKFVWNLIIALISVFLMITVGDLVFGANVSFNLLILPIIFFGVFGFVSLGIIAGAISKSEETASVIGNIITFPMMFLSGTFFPVALMPVYLQEFARFLPLYYVIDGMNSVTLFSNMGSYVVDLAVTAAISIAFFMIALKVFSWRER